MLLFFFNVVKHRLKKQELASLAQSAEEILRSVTKSTKRDISNAEKSDVEPRGELPSKQVDRKRIVISIQDKDGQKQFRMYMVLLLDFLYNADCRVISSRILIFFFS